MSSLVSVLMPVLNEEAAIVETLTSVLAQEGVEVEILVVDGRSADRTAQLVTEIASREPRVRLLTNDKTSIPAGLNIGLEHSSGEFIARVDGHTALSEGYFRRALECFAANPQLGGVGGKRVGVSATPTGRAIALALSSKFGVGNSINHYADTAQLTDHASLGVYRTAVAREVDGWDESLPVNEDVDFDLRILGTGHVIGFDPAMEVQWKVRDRVVDLFRQYRRYGRGKAAMIRKNGREAMRLRHALPPVAVVGGAVLSVAALRRPKVLIVGLPYLVALVAASSRAWQRRDPSERTSAVSLPLAFVAMHGGWGLGFLEGYLLGSAPARASGNSVTAADRP